MGCNSFSLFFFFLYLFCCNLCRQLFLSHRKQQEQNGRCHNKGYACKNSRIVRTAAVFYQKTNQQQRIHTPYRSHKINHCIGLASQMLRCQIRHQSHCRRAVKSHGNQQYGQTNHKHKKIFCPVCPRQYHQKNNRDTRSCQYKRRPLSQRRIRLVRKSAEKRKQKHSQHIIRGHNHSRESFIQMKRILQYQRNDIVVHLPESTDGKKGQPDKKGAAVIQFFHSIPPP